MSDRTVISVGNVSKNFRLPHERANSIKSLFVNPFQKKLKNASELQHALRNISFDVQEGEFFGIVGRNGSGKSTLLKIIAGIYQPNKGQVKVSGRLVPFIELGVGFNPELTGRENVYLNGALLGFSKKEIDAKYATIVEFAEIERFMDQKLKNYSSGMQVRLAFSVATVLAESDVLLIDEVLAVGDADFQRKCFEYFKKLKKDKKTVIFVSHDMSAVREYCDRAILIDNSRVIFSGSSEEAAKEYTRLFLPEVYKEEKGRAASQARAGNSTDVEAKWGSGGVDITDVSMLKQIYAAKDRDIVISYRVTREGGFNDTINPGIVIKNAEGQPLCGTNTNITLGEKRKLLLGDTNESMEVRWTVSNIFNAGRYTVDLAVLSASNGDTLQWWDDAGSFRVVNEKTTPYPVSPPVGVEIR